MSEPRFEYRAVIQNRRKKLTNTAYCAQKQKNHRNIEALIVALIADA